MKKLLLSMFILFISFSCEIDPPPKKELILNYQLTDSFKINGQFNNYDDDLTYGIIYKFNPTLEEVENLTKENDVIDKVVNLNKNNSFSYTFNHEEFNMYSYITPLIVRGYVMDNEENITYTKEVLKEVIYNIALNSGTTYARSIVSQVDNLNTSYEDIDISISLSEEDNGYIINSSFNNLEEGDLFGYIYKNNAYFYEQEDFDLRSNNLNYYLFDDITSNELSLVISDIHKYNYYDDITIRAFIYNDENKTIKFSNEILTSSLYDLALKEDTSFSRSVVKFVNRNITRINEIFINTDVNKEYEVDSFTKGLDVSMYFDYYIVKLTVNVLKGYKISEDMIKENIVVKIVMDGIVVKDFTCEISKDEIIIIYDDYGWGPPM